MKKVFLIGLAALPLLFASCSGNDSEATQRADSLQEVINQKDDEIASLFEVLGDIENNLTEISARYNKINALKQQNPEKNANVKGEITDQLAMIESLMSQNKSKIAQLNDKVGTLTQQNTQLEGFIATLNTRIDEQENEITSLMEELTISKETIQKLSNDVDKLSKSNRDKDIVIAQQNDEMAYLADQSHRAYYVVGEYKDLKEKGIVNKEGGLIFKSQKTTRNVNVNNFNLIDRFKVTTIDVNLKNAKVISDHPKGSYELVMDESNKKICRQLIITDTKEFWKNTDFLIISTK